jgi:hypothetical protein
LRCSRAGQTPPPTLGRRVRGTQSGGRVSLLRRRR